MASSSEGDSPGSCTATARALLELVAHRPPSLGEGRLLCIDGPAGSGKSILADAVVTAAGSGTQVLHTDEMLAGWDGLPHLGGTVSALLAPLAEGRPGTWTRWDWHRSEWAEQHEVRPGGLLVLEGCGAWSPEIGPWVTALAWLEAAHGVRLERGLARDGEAFAPHWERWARAETELFARLGTREHADLVLDTTPHEAGERHR